MYEKIRDILLEHRGRDNPVTSKEISAEMGFPMEDTQRKSREAIRETAEIYKLPLLSYSKGYYIAENDEEIEDFNNNIQSRIDGMEEMRKQMNENYKKLKNGKG